MQGPVDGKSPAVEGRGKARIASWTLRAWSRNVSSFAVMICGKGLPSLSMARNGR